MSRRSTRWAAFTLVELLVVIGIIAVLIALLLPTLSGAREQANRVKCLANLRSMCQAAQYHAAEHMGYMPMAGPAEPATLGVSATPEGLADAQQRKYMYMRTSDTWRPVPINMALGYYMGLRDEVNAIASITTIDLSIREGRLAAPAFRTRFGCPSQDLSTMTPGFALYESNGLVAPRIYMSYMFNSTVLGRSVWPFGDVSYKPFDETPAGKVSKVASPSTVFLFADCKGPGFRGFGIMAEGIKYQTLFNTWDTSFESQFDKVRHRNRINVAFVDGHVETLMLPSRKILGEPQSPGDMDRVGLLKGIFRQ